MLGESFTPGVFDAMDSAKYHRVEALSASGCKKMLRSPAHFRLMRDTPNQPTAAMEFGTTVHDGVLEPAAFSNRVVCVPDDAPNRPTKAQRNAKKPSPESLAAIDYWNTFDALNAGRIVLSAADFNRARCCIDAVNAHPTARALLADAVVETSLMWHDGATGVPCKARIDARNHGGLIDLKTTSDASPDGFARQAASLLYHVQAAFYFYGAEHVLNATPGFFGFVCVESEPPYAVACYSIPSNALQAGKRLADDAINRYAHALRVGAWQGYSERVETLRFPKWALTFPQ